MRVFVRLYRSVRECVCVCVCRIDSHCLLLTLVFTLTRCHLSLKREEEAEPDAALKMDSQLLELFLRCELGLSLPQGFVFSGDICRNDAVM